jgi:hypothetical protein
LGPRQPPGLKELTIELGDSDIYVNMSRRLDMDNGHTLYEAVLTDATGSRAIYIDRDDIVECLKDSFIQVPPEAKASPPNPGEPRKDARGRP